MPNFCENTLKVEGSPKELEKFIKRARTNKAQYKSELSFNKFIPIPKELNKTTSPNTVNPEEMKKKFGAKDWYDWKNRMWGIKWDVCADKQRDGKTTVFYHFDSPWGPPIEGIYKISKLCPKLHFYLEYEEGGMAFAGIYDIKDGAIKEDRTWDIGYCQECQERSDDPKKELNKKGLCEDCQRSEKERLKALRKKNKIRK